MKKIATTSLAILLLSGCGARDGAPSGETNASTVQSAANASVQPESTQDNSPPPPQKEEKPQFSSLDFGIKKGQFGIKTVKGTLLNNTDRQFGYVQVEINLYDKEGAQVGSTLANVNNLAPGAKWKYEAPIMDENVTKAELVNISAY